MQYQLLVLLLLSPVLHARIIYHTHIVTHTVKGHHGAGVAPSGIPDALNSNENKVMDDNDLAERRSHKHRTKKVVDVYVTRSITVHTAPPSSPTPEAPKPKEEPKPEAPKEEPKPEAPEPKDEPKPEAPKPEAPKPEAPKPEAPKPEAPKPEAPKPTPSFTTVFTTTHRQTTSDRPTTTSSSAAPVPPPPKSSPKSDSFKDTMLDTHNYFRSKHIRGRPLVWDDELARGAQQYADRYPCDGILTHSQTQYGENLALGYNSKAAVDAWYNEVDEYNYSKPGFSHATGHFTQIVWEKTKRLGCAYVNCPSPYGQYTICRYDPPGNVIGQFEQNVQRAL